MFCWIFFAEIQCVETEQKTNLRHINSLSQSWSLIYRGPGTPTCVRPLWKTEKFGGWGVISKGDMAYLLLAFTTRLAHPGSWCLETLNHPSSCRLKVQPSALQGCFRWQSIGPLRTHCDLAVAGGIRHLHSQRHLSTGVGDARWDPHEAVLPCGLWLPWHSQLWRG